MKKVSFGTVSHGTLRGEIVQVEAGTERPKINGYILEVNDHGNMTLYYRSRNGHVKELWGVV